MDVVTLSPFLVLTYFLKVLLIFMHLLIQSLSNGLTTALMRSLKKIVGAMELWGDDRLSSWSWSALSLIITTLFFESSNIVVH